MGLEIVGGGGLLGDVLAELLQVRQRFLEALGQSVAGLHGLDRVVLLVVHQRVEDPEAGVAVQQVRYFRNAAGDAGAVAQLLVPFEAGSELESEPVQGAQLGDLLVSGSEGKQSDLLGEFLSYRKILRRRRGRQTWAHGR